MFQIKSYIITLLSLLIISCNNDTKNSQKYINNNFELIGTILKGETLGKKNTKKSFTEKTINYSCNINYVGNKQTSNEVDLLFKPTKIETCYKSLITFYNQHFKSNKNNKVFNTWSTDSLEVLLFKQTDSTILVNIFIKPYR